MVAFYKEVCIIYGAEHPLHILWLYNFISGLVAQLGERSVRIPMSHIDLRVSAHVFGENFLRNLLKSKNLKICFLLQKPRKKPQYGPIAQLGERSVRIREVVGSNPIRSTISRKITANLAVIFRLTTIIPQTAENSDRF